MSDHKTPDVPETPITEEMLKEAKRELDAAMEIACDVTESRGQRCMVNGISQLSCAVISRWLELAPTEPVITLRELKALVEEKKQAKWMKEPLTMEKGIENGHADIHNTALTDLYEAAEKGSG